MTTRPGTSSSRTRAVAAVHLHAAAPPAWLDTLDEPALAALPGRALACLDQLQAAGHYGDIGDLRDHLGAMDRLAPVLAVGAERPPFGMRHGELHPSALHISATGWRLLDFSPPGPDYADPPTQPPSGTSSSTTSASVATPTPGRSRRPAS